MPKLVTEFLADESGLQSAAKPWRRLAQILARLQRQRRRTRELPLLGMSACRDLGLDPSELSSYEAEAAGIANRTRRRVAHDDDDQ